MSRYPHQLSGGMRQRAVIAMALSCNPALLVADEPTTALDVTVQAGILDLVRKLRATHNSAVVFITHDMGVVSELADRVMVMYAGRVVERGSRAELFSDPRHPYTRALLGSIPPLTGEKPRRLPAIPGSPPSLLRLPQGCAFGPRCPVQYRALRGRQAEPWRRYPRRGMLPGGASMSGPMTDKNRPILETRALGKRFSIGSRFSSEGKRTVHAVDNVSLTVRRGETVGLVGESGCGKSTLARCLVRLYDITDGELLFEGDDITSKSLGELRPLRRRLQMVFQDPSASLNPRRRVGDLVAEPLRIHTKLSSGEIAKRVAELFDLVGLLPDHVMRYPHEFSGGQRQRVGIARAIALNPDLVVLDEPVSALDVSVQAQIVNLLADLQEKLKLTYIFIAHDLSVVRQVSTRIAVMYLGSIVEEGPAEEVFSTPAHPYSQALISAVPVVETTPSGTRRRIILTGDVPSPLNPPSGCRFHPRCPIATDRCRTERPEAREHRPGRKVACHYPTI